MGEAFDVVKKWLKAIEERDVKKFSELTSEEISFYDHIAEEFRSTQGQILQALLGKVPVIQYTQDPVNMTRKEASVYRNITMAPPLRIELNSNLEFGNEIWVDYFVFIKHSNLFYGVSPTGKEIKIRTIGKYVVENGKIVKSDAIFDNLTMIQQIGILIARENDEEKIINYLQQLRELGNIE